MQTVETTTSSPNSTNAVLAAGQRTCPKCGSNWDGGKKLLHITSDDKQSF